MTRPPASPGILALLAVSVGLLAGGCGRDAHPYRSAPKAEQYSAAAEAVTRLAEAEGGYVADTRSSKSDQGKERGSLTIRVPAGRFAATMAALKKLGSVRAESMGTQYITNAYADIETRLRVKREALERMRAILRNQTGKLSDVIDAEREIARVTEEIERMEGERRFYDQQVALSTITVELFEPEPLLKGGAFEPIREAFSRSLGGESVAAVIYVTVFLTPWLLVLWVLWRTIRRLHARRKPVSS